MGLLADFQSFVTHTVGIQRQDKVLLAVSGGRDSMLMAYLFQDAGFECVLAHCNFQLRGEDSDLDEALVRGFADVNRFPFLLSILIPSVMPRKSMSRYKWLHVIYVMLGLKSSA